MSESGFSFVSMTLLERALIEVVTVLESLQIDHMVIGGIANAVWGEARATLDVDVSVAVDEAQIPDTAAALGLRFRVLIDDAARFIRETRVLPLETTGGVRIDVIFALLPFELEAIDRARRVVLAGRDVKVVSPEDLILMKIISERTRDVADAEAITRRRRDDLDVAYLEPRIRELASLLDKPEIVTKWETWRSGTA